ncbi:MAG: ABC transporter ATP-binding protein [Acidobacteriales bacterium]|nr:ABC transporter ATP-binding protein [Terriglobales bacterium]
MCTRTIGKSLKHQESEYHWALRDINFRLRPGEALGVIGPNGAGKTTLLKILSRVTRPTSGRIHVAGRLAALIELGAGFHPDLTGRENIFLNGAILGMTRSQTKAKLDRITDFAGIGKYLDTPVKRYSSGMYARLGFAIAAHLDPEILLVDEVLAVGDYAFQMKCYARMDELRANGTTLIFVSHNLEAVRRVCGQGLVIYRGRSIYQGPAANAVAAYSDAVRSAAREMPAAVPVDGGLSSRILTFDAELESVSLLDADGRSVSSVESGSDASVLINVVFNKDTLQPIFAFTIRTLDGILVYNTTTCWMNIQTQDFRAGERCSVEFRVKLRLLGGNYELGVDIAASDLSHFYDRTECSLNFVVTDSDRAKGLADLESTVSICSTPVVHR